MTLSFQLIAAALAVATSCFCYLTSRSLGVHRHSKTIDCVLAGATAAVMFVVASDRLPSWFDGRRSRAPAVVSTERVSSNPATPERTVDQQVR